MQDLKEHLEVISEIKRKLKSSVLTSLMISGSHLYGWSEKSSDIDYRGTFQVHTNRFLGLGSYRDSLLFNMGNNDVCVFEIKKEVELSLKGNCNALERINAKQLLSTAEFLELRRLVNNAWGKIGIYNSYKGMATFNYKKFILQGRNSVKKYLYVYRGLMAGIYALETGQIQPNISELNRYFKIKEIKELVDLKKSGKKVLPKEHDTGNLEKLINKLYMRMDKSFVKSKIPDRASDKDRKEISDFLISIRKDFME